MRTGMRYSSIHLRPSGESACASRIEYGTSSPMSDSSNDERHASRRAGAQESSVGKVGATGQRWGENRRAAPAERGGLGRAGRTAVDHQRLLRPDPLPPVLVDLNVAPEAVVPIVRAVREWVLAANEAELGSEVGADGRGVDRYSLLGHAAQQRVDGLLQQLAVQVPQPAQHTHVSSASFHLGSSGKKRGRGGRGSSRQVDA